ncbi:hypothetical protein RHGRI_028510 [Rhododendron griersonianum]|uniref:Pentatricopeptide repeat-containing protein n=1 Tax=Rhododendron griersonianum TaxID=479676 RepID=A0AAV6IGS9_9ERIC|nr:hypothetical protein RHGRI_028510 [Rhododendron griersonianum]
MNGTSKAVSKTKHLIITTTSAAKYGFLLHHYATTKSLAPTTHLHAHLITSGHLSARLLPLLTSSYAACGHISYARKLFDKMPEPPLLAYNTMIRVYTLNGSSREAIQLFVEMLAAGYPRPDKFTFPFVVKACGDLKLLGLGVSVHGLAVTGGVKLETFLGNCLLAMYMNCGEKEVARRVFDAMMERSEVTWNTMISGYCRNGFAEEALKMFKEMVGAGVEPNNATLVSVLPACGHLKDLKCGMEILELVQESGLGSCLPVNNALMDMFAKCGCMTEARLVFDKMDKRDVVTWTTLINGYNWNGDGKKALMLCPLMLLEGIRPNAVTVPSLLSTCADLGLLKQGRCLHGWVLRQKLESDVSVETALIDMYAKCSCIRGSFRVFVKTSRKRTVPWNAILSGCIHNGLATEAIDCFKKMLSESVAPNAASLNSLLPAYARLADLQQAMNIHGYLIRSGFVSKVEASTALIDIYSKCGSLYFAHEIFNGIPEKDKDIFCWSAIIASYGMHGNGEIAVSLFNQMVQLGVVPNEVTFTSVLHACSHSGLVDEGLDLFNFMVGVHQMRPRSNHYTCMVDLLGRAGRLEEAYALITTMPFEPNNAVWGALLGACVIHENVELGELASEWLFKLEPENTGNYVLMAKLYAAAGRWKDAEKTRNMLDGIGIRKNPAHSLIEVRNM